MSIIIMANLNLFSHSYSHVHDHSVASCDAIPQAPTSFTPDAATVPVWFSSLVAVTVLDRCNSCHQKLYLHLRKACSYYETHTQTVVYSAAQARMPVCGESLKEVNAVVFHLHTGYFPRIPGT